MRSIGWNDFYIPRHPPKEFGKGYLGHDLGDASYVLSQAPDLISFCGPKGSLEPCFIADRQLTENDTFKNKYVPAYFQTPAPLVTTSIIWVKTDSPKIGIQLAKDSIVIPCWLISDSKHMVTQSKTKGFKINVGAGDSLHINELLLPPGKWTLNNSSLQFLTNTVLDTNKVQALKEEERRTVYTKGGNSRRNIIVLSKTTMEISQISFTKTEENQ